MGKNYLQQRQERDREFFHAGMRTGSQFVTDYMVQTLTDPEVMGKNRVLGRATLEKVLMNCKKLDEYFSIAFSDHVEADYRREEWDTVMRDIFGEEADSFEKRYPYSREIKYCKPKKGWVD